MLCRINHPCLKVIPQQEGKSFFKKKHGTATTPYLASRKPVKARYRVRGMGVADSVRTSIEDLYDAIFSFCWTPNFCKEKR
jgi:hypothetical protein